MAIRETLGVAACSIALAAACLTGALPATAAPLPASGSLGITAQPGNSGNVPPSQAQLDAAKSDPEALNALVDSLESQIESGRQDIITAEAAALDAQDNLLAADELLSERTQAADEARTEADKATEFLLSSKEDVGALASNLYRNGGVNPGVVTLLEDAEDNDVLYKASTMDALSANRTMTVSNAEDAAALWTAWQDYAAAAATAADEATAAQRTAAAEAANTLTSFQESVAPQEQLRAQLIDQIAYLHEVDAAEEAERIAAKEAEAEAARLQALIDTAEDSKPPEIEVSKTPEILPLAVPPKVPEDRQQGQTLVPKASAPKAPQLTVESPSKEPESTPAPKPAPETPKETAKPKATPTPEAPKETTKPKATPKPVVPKETAKPKATPTPEAPKETAKPKATPKPVVPKETAKPKPAPESVKPQSSRNYNAAISWAQKIANDNSKGYVYGANGPSNYDCSSFTQAAFAKSGISLPRTSSQQYAAAPTKVPLSQLRRGDLVFSSSNGGSSFYHVAIYLGGGQVLHARNPSSGISVTPLSWVNNLHSYAGRY